ncbi:hypothetical protein SAMN06265784_12241 [Paraburkholderia susongensis]|uniref:Addiction module antidote protein n=2 Tax=Paraburkholderia susongensis TaxID=1515439 RepID=A0A1X7M614_9BURK|nr:hypothetical protein SAMN06265784_12241 [Paraburkholderia susongensis]
MPAGGFRRSLGTRKLPAISSRYDVAEHLRIEEETQAYLGAAFENGGDDATFVTRAIRDVARARSLVSKMRERGADIEQD